jgi:hypothetical protein
MQVLSINLKIKFDVWFTPFSSLLTYMIFQNTHGQYSSLFIENILVMFSSLFIKYTCAVSSVFIEYTCTIFQLIHRIHTYSIPVYSYIIHMYSISVYAYNTHVHYSSLFIEHTCTVFQFIHKTHMYSIPVYS